MQFWVPTRYFLSTNIIEYPHKGFLISLPIIYDGITDDKSKRIWFAYAHRKC